MLTHKGTQTIETPRLILRRAVREDAQAMLRNWASDPEVTKFLTWPTHDSIDVTRTVLESWLAEYEKDNYYQWMIVLKEIGEPIGSISVVRQNQRVEAAEIGYCIGSAWWHQGIMSEALAAVINYLFTEVGMNRITAAMTRFARDNRGEGYLDMAMKILIVVVVGAAILAIMNTAMPNLFQSLINKISNELVKVTVLP